MIKKIGVILLAVLFLGSMAWTPVFDAAYAAVKCECGKDCQCDHCKTGKGDCNCKGGCNCGQCGTGKMGKKGMAGKGCNNCRTASKAGCNCGKDCQCDHCKTGKGDCNCKGGCNCGQRGTGKMGKKGMAGKGCNNCRTASKAGCNCGKDCQCNHCKTGKGGCQCGKDCNCGHCAKGGADMSAQKPASDADYAKSMKSKAGTFAVSYTSDPEAIAPNKLMSWKLKVETADGQPVKDAEITVEGAMPEHGHGLPTQPKVKKNGVDGTYLVEGIKFSMTGWWTMTFTIKAGDKTDSVTFNLQLK